MKKSIWRCHHFIQVYPKLQSYDVCLLRYGVRQTAFFVILDHFLPFYPHNNLENKNFEKMKKNFWRYYHFTHVYHIRKSYDVWLLRYGAQQTDFFLIFNHFLSFHFPLTAKKIKIFKK